MVLRHCFIGATTTDSDSIHPSSIQDETLHRNLVSQLSAVWGAGRRGKRKVKSRPIKPRLLKLAYSLTNCGVGCTSHSPNQLLSPLKLICLAFPASRDSHGIENHCTKEKEGGEGSEIGPFPVIVGQLLLMPKCKRNFYCLSSPLSPPQLDVGASPNPLARSLLTAPTPCPTPTNNRRKRGRQWRCKKPPRSE